MPELRTAGSADVDEKDLSRPELEERARALVAVNAVADVVLGAVDARDVVGEALEAIARRTRFPAIAVYRVNDSSPQLDLVCSRGIAGAVPLAVESLPLEGSLTGAAVKERRIVTSADVGLDVWVLPNLRQSLAEEGFTASVSVPLLVGDRPIGTMNLLFKDGDVRFSGSEGEMLTSIGKAIALAMERARFIGCPSSRNGSAAMQRCEASAMG